MSKFLILTAIAEGKDDLIDPKIKFDDCDYIAFVDKSFSVPIWEQRALTEFSTLDRFAARRNAKIYKILAANLFPQYEYVIWQDGNHHIVKHPSEIVAKYGRFDLLCFRHPDRSCWLQETKIVASFEMDTKENILAQAEFYLRQNLPAESGLYELSTIIRKNTQVVREMEMMWWEQICKFSSRDQISFPYVLWRLGNRIEIKLMSGFANLHAIFGNTGGNPYFYDTGSHKK